MIRVLVIDCHEQVRAALVECLRSASDIEIVGSTSHYEVALEQAQRLAPDVILLEVKTPEGLDLLRALCRPGHRCRVIVLTSYADSFEEDVSRELGASRYLLKTLDPHRLVCEIRAVAQQ